jgi:hypothetical protein
LDSVSFPACGARENEDDPGNHHLRPEEFGPAKSLESRPKILGNIDSRYSGFGYSAFFQNIMGWKISLSLSLP